MNKNNPPPSADRPNEFMQDEQAHYQKRAQAQIEAQKEALKAKYGAITRISLGDAFNASSEAAKKAYNESLEQIKTTPMSYQGQGMKMPPNHPMVNEAKRKLINEQ